MSNQLPPASTHRSLTGFVTKLVGDGATYGFINDEIFFPQTNVTGGPASVGDQVFAECEYSAHLPIKWNATAVKILNKATSQQQPRSDQQPQQQQSDLLNQQQQQFNQGNNVAVTYQQHRQQRQQRQMLDVKQPDGNVKQPSHQQHQQNTDLTQKLLENTNNPSGGEYFAQGQARHFPQQMDGNIQPFQDQPPMGPPNFTYTSQLGSAFVQNQFVPAPFMTQQPPPMLPQQQQQQQQQPPPPQHLLPINQPSNTHNNQNNQNNQRNNKNQGGGGGRFNNQGEKNERQNNRRNQNRNDNNKFDRPRSGDRDGNAQNNNKQQKSNDNRDRSSGRNNRRDDAPSRPSPPAHSSARSTTSVSSDRGAKSRRHYEVQNVPKTRIMTNMNAFNMKQRCPSSVHVPSDLKDIIVNEFFRLDIKNIPKPLKYTIEEAKEEVVTTQETEKVKADEASSTETAKKEGDAEVVVEPSDEIKQESTSQESNTDIKKEEKQEVKSQEHPTPPSSKSDIRLNHKYGVKVILLSMPEIENIYRSVFGSNLDSFNHEIKSTRSRFDEAISLLCNKSQNHGHSLIGGKFDPVIDGFIEGGINEFERNSRQPDLIATCKRVVQEQTGLDLSCCRSWTLLSTFMYNNKSDYFSPKASIEYSFIYMPQIWTMLSDKFDRKITEKESSEIKVEESISNSDNLPVESIESSAMEVQESETAPTQSVDIATVADSNEPSSSISSSEAITTINPESLAELKVSDLKAELDKRDIKYKTGAKKAELIALLHEYLLSSQAPPPVDKIDEVKESAEDCTAAATTTTASSQNEPQLEEGEVEANPSEDSPVSECDAATEANSKRKASDMDDEPESKKVCTESPVKERKVELIQETFVVRGRDKQQQLSLVSLYEAAQASRYDQFELSVASNILKESLIQHLSEYILTTLVEDNKQKLSTSTTNNSGSHSSSQETNSDTNNNSTKTTFKNPTKTSEPKVSLKEFPVDRYINLAFSYFDSSHMGYVYFDDLNKLFNNTGLTISKRALMSLTGDCEKFNYKTLPDLSPKVSPTYVYEFPEQFSQLPFASRSSATGEQKNLISAGNMVEYKGVMYDVAKLVQQVREAETLRVSLVDRFNYAIENSDRQAEEIHVLEVSQKSLAKAIKAQNDEICDLKRERDSIKKKYDNVRKGIKGTVTSLSDLIKDDK